MTSTWLNYALWSCSPDPFLSAGQPFINLRDRIVLLFFTHRIPGFALSPGEQHRDAVCRGVETLCVMLSRSVAKSIYTMPSSRAGLRFFFCGCSNHIKHCCCFDQWQEIQLQKVAAKSHKNEPLAFARGSGIICPEMQPRTVYIIRLFNGHCIRPITEFPSSLWATCEYQIYSLITALNTAVNSILKLWCCVLVFNQVRFGNAQCVSVIKSDRCRCS